MSYCGGPEPLEMEVPWDRSHKITGKTEDSESWHRKVGLVPSLAGGSIHWRPVDLTSQPVAHEFSYSRSVYIWPFGPPKCMKMVSAAAGERGRRDTGA